MSLTAQLIAPLLAALALLAVATALGAPLVRGRIEAREALHELRSGSASQLRRLAGWVAVALWLMVVWYLSTIIGDWMVTGDLADAVDRSWIRLRILLEIAMALGDS